MSDHLIQFQREKTALKYFLIGRNYHLALKALGFAERYHVGLRKDGKTPELHHQVRIALTITQLKDVTNEELCLVAALLHDVQEDYQIPSETIEDEFGPRSREINWRLTKKFGTVHKNKQEVIDELALDSEGSIVKGVDRLDNLQSMIGVFSLEKIKSYALEAKTVFLPMLKKAEKLFPEQQAAYHSISQQIKQILKLVSFYVAAATEQATLAEKLETAESKIARHDEDILRLEDNYKSFMDRMLNSIFSAVDATDIHTFRMKIKALKESGCERKHLHEGFLKALNVIKADKQLSNATILSLREQLRIEFGLSELDLYNFDDRVTGPIPS